jgi:hypothetical protein
LVELYKAAGLIESKPRLVRPVSLAQPIPEEALSV